MQLLGQGLTKTAQVCEGNWARDQKDGAGARMRAGRMTRRMETIRPMAAGQGPQQLACKQRSSDAVQESQ